MGKKRTKPTSPSVKADRGEGLSFDLTAKVIPVTIGDVEYELREESTAIICKWQNTLMSTATIVDGKLKGATNMMDREPELVALCLYEVESGENVPLATVRAWPNRISKQLYKVAQEINGLAGDEEEVDEDSKNSQSDTTDG